MKTMNFIIIIFSLILINRCYSPLHSPYDYEYIADKITARTIQQLEKEKNLFAIGTGGGMLGDIYKMEISFNYYQPVDLTEARILLVSAIQTYVNNINESKEVRPYLHNYPATLKDIKITIFVHQDNKTEIPVGEIVVVKTQDNRLFYKLAIADKFAPWPILKEESYEEALQLLGQE